MPVTLDVPTLSPFSVPPGPQSGWWRNTNVLPPPSALLLERAVSFMVDIFFAFCFQEAIIPALPKSAFKERPREAEEEAARAESCIHV